MFAICLSRIIWCMYLIVIFMNLFVLFPLCYLTACVIYWNWALFLSHPWNLSPYCWKLVETLNIILWNPYDFLLFVTLCLQVKCVEVFKEFYQTKTKNRKLTWIYSLGTCNIFGNFNAKSVELIVTTYQVNSFYVYFFK